ncbi:hypothetical protein EV363DRAFT_1242828 [Boletus edulis]|nr:hypothetical protein EV363DRAFT_1242828 [Boletus edulis]
MHRLSTPTSWTCSGAFWPCLSPPLTDGEEIDDDASSFVEPELPSHPAPIRMTSMDKETRARRLVARLRQLFGALLVTLASTGRRTTDYRWAAADRYSFRKVSPLAVFWTMYVYSMCCNVASQITNEYYAVGYNGTLGSSSTIACSRIDYPWT